MTLKPMAVKKSPTLMEEINRLLLQHPPSGPAPKYFETFSPGVGGEARRRSTNERA